MIINSSLGVTGSFIILISESSTFNNNVLLVKWIIFRETVKILVAAGIIVYFWRALNMFKQRMLFSL